MRPFLLVCISALPVAFAIAEEEPPIAPALPLQLPEEIAWSVEPHQPSTTENNETEADEAVTPPLRQRAFVRQPGDLRIRNYRDGRMIRESWITEGDRIFHRLPDGEVVARPLVGEDQELRQLFRGQLPEFTWLSPNNYRGIVDFEGTPTHLYSDRVLETDIWEKLHENGQEEVEVFKVESRRAAWICAETNLPVAEFRNGVMHLYQFQALSRPIAMPAEFVQAKERVKEARERNRRRHSGH